jgi:hypothetical protein
MAATNSKTELEIRRGIALAGNKTVAEAIGGDETLVSRFLSGERGMRIDHLGPLLDRIGLKVVPISDTSVDPVEWHAVQTLASKYFK